MTDLTHLIGRLRELEKKATSGSAQWDLLKADLLLSEAAEWLEELRSRNDGREKVLTAIAEQAEQTRTVLRNRIAELSAANQSLTARVAGMEEALRPFADEADAMGDDMPDARRIDDLGVREITEGHLRRARAALNPVEGE